MKKYTWTSGLVHRILRPTINRWRLWFILFSLFRSCIRKKVSYDQTKARFELVTPRMSRYYDLEATNNLNEVNNKDDGNHQMTGSEVSQSQHNDNDFVTLLLQTNTRKWLEMVFWVHNKWCNHHKTTMTLWTLLLQTNTRKSLETVFWIQVQMMKIISDNYSKSTSEWKRF